MTIGVIGSFYDCAEHLADVLEPWLALKQQGVPLVLTAVNAQFKEYAELGYPNDDHATRALLEAYRSKIEYVHIAPEPLLEKEVRNLALVYLLKQQVDLVWILDGDEVYTTEEIQRVISFIEQTPQFDYYHIYLNNYMFGRQSTAVFAPPRVFRVNRRDGLKQFTFDNSIEYADGKDLYASIPGMIPRSIAFVTHHTWQAKNVARKIQYHRKHFGFCPFTFTPDSNTIALDTLYFEHHHLPMPTVDAEHIRFPPPPSVHIHLDLYDTTDAVMERCIVFVISALLALERENSYTLRFTVAAPADMHLTISGALKLCPFSSQVITTRDTKPGPLSLTPAIANTSPQTVLDYLQNEMQKMGLRALSTYSLPDATTPAS